MVEDIVVLIGPAQGQSSPKSHSKTISKVLKSYFEAHLIIPDD